MEAGADELEDLLLVAATGVTLAAELEVDLLDDAAELEVAILEETARTVAVEVVVVEVVAEAAPYLFVKVITAPLAIVAVTRDPTERFTSSARSSASRTSLLCP